MEGKSNSVQEKERGKREEGEKEGRRVKKRAVPDDGSARGETSADMELHVTGFIISGLVFPHFATRSSDASRGGK